MKRIVCVLALVCLLFPAAFPAGAEAPAMRFSVNFENVKSWFQQSHPEIALTRLNEGIEISTSEALNALGGEEPLDLLMVRSSDCDVETLLYSGLLEDLSGNEDIRQSVEDMYEPFRRLLTTADGAVNGMLSVSGWAMHRVPAAWEAAGLSAEDAPQSFVELLDFAQRWAELVKEGEVGNVRLNALKTWGVPNDDTRYTLWLTDLLWQCWAMRQQEAKEPVVFDTPEFIELAKRAREVGQTLAGAEEKPGKKSLSLYDCGLYRGMGYGAENLYQNAFPMRVSIDEPVRIKGIALMFVVRRGSPYAQACMEYIAETFARTAPDSVGSPTLYQQELMEGAWDGYGLTDEWRESYRPDWLFFMIEPFRSNSAYAQKEKLFMQFARNQIDAQELARGLDEARRKNSG